MIDAKSDWKILDLGGGTGEHIAKVFPGQSDITVCDYDVGDLEKAAQRGYKTVLADGTDDRLPFDDQAFDLVFCSSVIEHVTGPKEQATATIDGRAFSSSARQFQSRFADEIRRVGKRYYVQTPHKGFLIESHSWLPLPFVYLPRPAQIKILRLSGAMLPKRTRPDWHLLYPTDMRNMFPDAVVLVERVFGWPKSVLAVKGLR